MTTTSKSQLRQHYRAQRRHLTPIQRQKAVLTITQRILQHKAYQQTQHIGCYWANDGEVSTQPLIEHMWQHNKCCYLPVLHPITPRHLQFARYQRDTALTPNRYQIPEPQATAQAVIANQQLDLVLMPLVAFDATGNRLGMGAGFYDQSFAFKQDYRLKPTLIGLAFECQKDPQLPTERWDIPLDYIVTEQHIYGALCQPNTG